MTERAPLVSVVIPAYNCRRYVREAVDSVLAQTFTDYEIIVVNDASTDDTPEILAEYESAGSIRVVTHERNRGLAAARNSGIRAARGTWVTFLDADDLWRPEKLDYHARILRERPDIVFVSNSGLFFNDGDAVEFPPLPEPPELTSVSWRRLLLGSSPFSASNATVRRDCLAEVGLFDEGLRAAEDRDLWLRIVRRFGGTLASGVINAYRRHPSNMTADPFHMKPNVLFVLEKTFREVACPRSLRARARAHAYLELAIVCYEAGLRVEGLKNLCASFAAWPLPLGREVRKTFLVRWLWVVKVLFGRSVFEAIWPRIKSLRGRPAGSSDGEEAP